MKRKRGMIAAITVLVILVLVFGGYHIYRYPSMFRSLSDNSLNDPQVEELREIILSQADIKVLVAYFSYSGTTRNIANAISEKTGGDLFEIISRNGYSNVYMESNSEIRGNKRPALTDTVENMEDYDIVFVGYPVWWHATPAPVSTFLESYDLTGKLIIPFCTSGGSDISETMPTFLNSCDGLAVYGERRINGTSQLDEWLSELGLTGQKRQDQPKQEETDIQGTVPEAVQKEGTEILEFENLPTYTYRQQEIELENQGQKIYGIAYIPDTESETVPLVICAHGLGGSYRSNAAYAEQLASHGLAAYCFDFRGGGGSRSDGDTTEMSVMTEVSDLEVIMDAASKWDFVDENKIVLLGTSQGGITSAIAAARHTDKISGLVLMYPAFLVGDAVHEQFGSLEEVPDSFRFNWITAGRPYVEDMWDYDVYEEIGNYKDKVLLMHGSEDGIVPISYSDHAAEVYEDAEYYVIDGAGHGFHGSTFDEAVRHIFDYLQKIEIIHTTQSAEIKIVPESYNGQAEHRGTVERFEYDSSGSTKIAYVYLPYGYEEEENARYNILYFMHGGGGNAGQRVSVFHQEFIQDLMPAVEGRYRTYAESTDQAGLEASRNHRAFGGFSMGAVTTWYQFANSLDYVAWFMPLSGDCWEYGNQGGASHPEETAGYLNDVAASARYGNDFYIYAMTGSDDIAYNAMHSQLEAMKETEGFTFGASSKEGNISFQVLDGATHDYTYYRNYIYTILPYFFGE